MAAVNSRLEDELDFDHTRLRRKMMDLPAARRGDENVGNAVGDAPPGGNDLRGKASPLPGRGHRAVLAVPKDSAFRVPLPETLAILDKPGSLEGVRCVTAVVDLPGRPYAVNIDTTFLRRQEDGEVAIKEISAALYEMFERLSRSSDLGRVISDK